MDWCHIVAGRRRWNLGSWWRYHESDGGGGRGYGRSRIVGNTGEGRWSVEWAQEGGNRHWWVRVTICDRTGIRPSSVVWQTR